MAQFLSQKEIDAGVLRSVTLAQIDEIKPRRLASVVDEWKKLNKSDAPPILAVTIVYNDYLAKNQEAVAKFLAATRNALQFGSKSKGRVAEILQKPQIGMQPMREATRTSGTEPTSQALSRPISIHSKKCTKLPKRPAALV